MHELKQNLKKNGIIELVYCFLAALITYSFNMTYLEPFTEDLYNTESDAFEKLNQTLSELVSIKLNCFDTFQIVNVNCYLMMTKLVVVVGFLFICGGDLVHMGTYADGYNTANAAADDHTDHDIDDDEDDNALFKNDN